MEKLRGDNPDEEGGWGFCLEGVSVYNKDVVCLGPRPICYGFAGSRWVLLWGYTWRWNRQLHSVVGITLGNERTPGTQEVLCHFIPVPPVPLMYGQEQYSPPKLQRRYNSRTDNFYLDNLLSDKA